MLNHTLNIITGVEVTSDKKIAQKCYTADVQTSLHRFLVSSSLQGNIWMENGSVFSELVMVSYRSFSWRLLKKCSSLFSPEILTDFLHPDQVSFSNNRETSFTDHLLTYQKVLLKTILIQLQIETLN